MGSGNKFQRQKKGLGALEKEGKGKGLWEKGMGKGQGVLHGNSRTLSLGFYLEASRENPNRTFTSFPSEPPHPLVVY